MTIDDIAGDFRARAGEFTGLGARVLFDLGDDGALLVDATAAPPEISVEPGEAEQGVGFEQGEPPRPVGQETLCQPARAREGGQQKRVGPHQEAGAQTR